MAEGSNGDATAGEDAAAHGDATARGDATSDPNGGADELDGTDGSEQDLVDGVLVAVQVASLVTATVAFALYFDGSTRIAVPGGAVGALATGFWLVALAAAGAAGKAHHRDARTRTLGHATITIGVALLALTGGLVLIDLGGILVTGGTLGVLLAIAGANLVLFDLIV